MTGNALEVAREKRQSNAEFARNNAQFRDAYKIVCGEDNEPTARQASKYRNKRGRVWSHFNAT